MNKNNKEIKREMGKIYDKHLDWVTVGRNMKLSFLGSLKDNPKVTLIIKLGVAANLGIWTLVILKVFEKISF